MRMAIEIGLLFTQIRNLDGLPRFHGKPNAGSRVRSIDAPFPRFGKYRRYVVHRDGAETIAFAKVKNPELRLTNPARAGEHGLENWLQIARRVRDDAQHVGGCRLLL